MAASIFQSSSYNNNNNGTDTRRYNTQGNGDEAPSPGMSLPVTDWEDSHISSWLSTLNLSSLASSFRDQGITGDVLVQLDNEALKDLGVGSVGQRLALLGGIYKLKELWGLEIEEGDYRPQSEEVRATMEPPITAPQLLSSLRQRDERIFRLEQELRRTTLFLARFQYDFSGICRYQGLGAPILDQPFRPFASALALTDSMAFDRTPSSLEAQLFNGNRSGKPSPSALQPPLYSPATSSAKASTPTRPTLAFDGGGGTTGSSTLNRPGTGAGSGWSGDERVRTPVSRSRLGSDASQQYQRHVMGHGQETSSGAMRGLSDSQPSASSTSPVTAASPAAQGAVSSPSSATFSTWARLGREASHSIPSTVQSKLTGQDLSRPSPSSPSLKNSVQAQTSATQSGRSTSPSPRPRSNSAAASPVTPASLQSQTVVKDSIKESTTPSSATSSTTGRDFTGTTTTLGSGDNPYKSFRVTLEDPCYKVLPAALKKYKINDDWRMYALFICYAATERCLSYDEKPLLLFQKLKEARQNPVFMLRHIRDVKSPIAIANAKAAARRESSATSASGTKKVGDAANNGSAGAKREILLQTGQDTTDDGSLHNLRSEAILTGPAAQLSDLNGPKTFAIAIYPYSCEREDEFDVNVGDTFVVLSKTKGWWVVQRDTNATGLGDIATTNPVDAAGKEEDSGGVGAEIRSGWVPAGCLIETSKPLAAVMPTEVGDGTAPVTLASQLGIDDATRDRQASGPRSPRDASSGAQDSHYEVASKATVEADDAVTPTPASVREASSSGGSTSGNPGGPMSRLQGPRPSASLTPSLGALDKASVPIPPSIITSTSTPGIMLMEYSSAAVAASSNSTTSTTSRSDGPPSVTGTASASLGAAGTGGGQEGAILELQKDDRLRVFKRYNHWSYCVQENGRHARGWVPSWYIGKISPKSGGGAVAPSTSTGTGAGIGDGGSNGGGGGVGRGNGAGNAEVPSPSPAHSNPLRGGGTGAQTQHTSTSDEDTTIRG